MTVIRHFVVNEPGLKDIEASGGVIDVDVAYDQVSRRTVVALYAGFPDDKGEYSPRSPCYCLTLAVTQEEAESFSGEEKIQGEHWMTAISHKVAGAMPEFVDGVKSKLKPDEAVVAR